MNQLLLIRIDRDKLHTAESAGKHTLHRISAAAADADDFYIDYVIGSALKLKARHVMYLQKISRLFVRRKDKAPLRRSNYVLLNSKLF